MTVETGVDTEAQVAKHRGRSTTSIALIVIGSLLLPLAGITVWVRNLVLDSSRYVDTVAPLSKDPAIREAVAQRVAARVVDVLDVEQRAQDALPTRAKFLAAPIAAGAQQLVDNATIKVLESDAFPKIWEFANENAHDQIVVALTGRTRGAVTTDDGKVVLNLGPLAQKVATQLGDLGIGVPENIDVSKINAKFVLVASDDLASVQTYARLLDKLAWILPLITLLLYAAAVYVGPRRRVALMRVGFGVAVAMVVSLVAYGFARSAYLDGLPSSVQSTAAAAAVFDTVTRFVERGLRTLLVLGLVVWAAAWLAGPSRGATAVRTRWNRLMGRAGEGIGEVVEIGPVGRWAAANVMGLRIGLFAVLVLTLFVWDRPTGLVILSLGVLGVVGLGVIQMLAAGGSADEPAPSA